MAIPKDPSRDPFRAKIDELRPRLPKSYTGGALALNPKLDPELLRRAMNRKCVYWEALPTLEKLADLHAQAAR